MVGTWLQLQSAGRQHEGGALSNFYFDRAHLTKSLEDQFSNHKGLLVYGAPRQGKTTLLKQSMEARSYVILHASDDFGFSDIARNYLLSIGCSVTTERKKRGRLGSKAEVKFKLPLVEAAASADGGYDSEHTMRNFTADVSNPNDVCYLLRESQIELPCLIIEHFERFRKKERRRALNFIKMCHEHELTKIVLVASSFDNPLTLWERIEFFANLVVMEILPLSREESQQFVKLALNATSHASGSEIGDSIYDLFSGAVGLTSDACALLSAPAGFTKPDLPTGSVKEMMSSAFRDRFSDYLTNLIEAIIAEN